MMMKRDCLIRSVAALLLFSVANLPPAVAAPRSGESGDLFPPFFTSDDHTTFSAQNFGEFYIYAEGDPTPSISFSGSLPSGVSFTDNGDGSAKISGAADSGTGGEYNLKLTAENGVEPAATQFFTLHVTEAPQITTDSSATFLVGNSESFEVIATGVPAPSFSISADPLPAGITFNDTGGGFAYLEGTPQSETGGTYFFTITACNDDSCTDQSFALTVQQTVEFTGASDTTFTVGTMGSFEVPTLGSPVPIFSVSAGFIPNGVGLNSFGGNSAFLEGTPEVGAGGVYNFTITACNDVNCADLPFELTVDEAPAITSASDTTFAVNNFGSFSVTATGFPAPALSVTGTLPDGVSFNKGTGELSGNPVEGTGGTYPLTFIASNGVDSDATQSFTLTVNEAAGITSNENATFEVGTPGTFTVTVTGFPTPTLTPGGTLPDGVTFDKGSGVLSGAPLGTGGIYPLTFIASNGVGPDAFQSFTLTVNASPGFTSADSTTFTVGSAGSFDVVRIGFPMPTVSVSGTLPDGVFFNDETGELSGTPASGTGGTYPLTFTASNGIGSAAEQSFTLTVNEAPTITSANSTTFTEGNFGSFTATASGFPAPTVSATGALPNAVTFVNGLLSGPPDAGTAGNYPITITATNGVGSNAQQSFSLNVAAAVCTAPPADAISWFAAEGNTKDLLGANDGSFVGTAAYAAGKVDQGFSFNGASYVSVPAAAGSLNLTGSQVTIEGWINPVATAGAVYFGKTANAANDYLLLLDAGQLSAIIKAGGSEKLVRGFSDYPTNSVPFIPTQGQWTHLALTYDGALIKLYANGVQVGQDTKTGNIDGSSSPFNLGGRAGSLFFTGRIDEVDVFGRALAQSEIQALFNASIAGKCRPAFALNSVVSRKTHGAAGDFDVPLPLMGAPGVECRTGGANGDHIIVITLSNGVASGSASITGGVGSVSGSPTFAGNKMSVNLTGVSNAQQISVELSGVTDAVGQTLTTSTVPMNVLLGDVNGNKQVNASDVSLVKAETSNPIAAGNFRADVSLNGMINGSDLSMTKAASGTFIP